MDINLPTVGEFLQNLTWTKVGLVLLGLVVIFVIISRIASFFLWPFVRGVVAGVICFVLLTWAAAHYDVSLKLKWVLWASIIVAIIGVFVRRPRHN